jgi:hypothetical protein
LIPKNICETIPLKNLNLCLTDKVDTEGHGLVTVKVEQKLPVVLDHLLQLLDTRRDALHDYDHVLVKSSLYCRFPEDKIPAREKDDCAVRKLIVKFYTKLPDVSAVLTKSY